MYIFRNQKECKSRRAHDFSPILPIYLFETSGLRWLCIEFYCSQLRWVRLQTLLDTQGSSPNGEPIREGSVNSMVILPSSKPSIHQISSHTLRLTNVLVIFQANFSNVGSSMFTCFFHCKKVSTPFQEMHEFPMQTAKSRPLHTWLAVQTTLTLKGLTKFTISESWHFIAGAVKSVKADHLFFTNFFQWMMAVKAYILSSKKNSPKQREVSSNRHLEKFSCVSSAGLLMLIIIFSEIKSPHLLTSWTLLQMSHGTKNSYFRVYGLFNRDPYFMFMK